jgi:hypothetical protein
VKQRAACVQDNIYNVNRDKSAAGFCHQVAAWVPDMICNFCLVKSHKIAITQQPPKLEKNKRRFGILRILQKSRCMFD